MKHMLKSTFLFMIISNFVFIINCSNERECIEEKRSDEYSLNPHNKEVIGFKISSSIIDRVKEVHEFGNLIIKTISPEDIILLKKAAISDQTTELIIREKVIETCVFIFQEILDLKTV